MAWRAHSGRTSRTEMITTRIEGLQKHLKEFRKHKRDERNKKSKALTRIKQLDDTEDERMLEEEEASKRRRYRGVVAEDHKREMDYRQRSRKLWLQEGDANTRFFYLAANGRRRPNQIMRLKIGE